MTSEMGSEIGKEQVRLLYAGSWYIVTIHCDGERHAIAMTANIRDAQQIAANWRSFVPSIRCVKLAEYLGQKGPEYVDA